MPTVNPAPFGPKPQFELADGTPAVGNLLFFYVNLSVGTKADTYTDHTGTVANTNPIVLNALGMPTTEIWFTSGLSYTVQYAPSNDADPPNSPIFTLNGLLGINDVTASMSSWVSGPTPTFISGTSFSLLGDQTSTFHPGRRISTTNAGGTVYGTIVSSVFGAVTTVAVVNDASALDAGLSAVSYGIDAATNPSEPLLPDTFPLRSGSLDATKRVRFELDGLTAGVTRVITVTDADFTIGGAAVPPANPTRQVLTSGTAATYTTPAGATYINVRAIGPGGGGAGSGDGGAGAATTFSGGSMSAGPGAGGRVGGLAATAAAAASGGDINISGATGTASASAIAGVYGAAGSGANSVLGGAGSAGAAGAGPTAGLAAATNSGSGGGGGGAVSGSGGGGGGNAGAYCERRISAPAGTYTYTIGPGGAAGASNANVAAGGAGAAGLIVVDEFYD